MIDGRHRRAIALVGLLLFIGGGLAACLGAGVFGTSRSNRYVFDNTMIRWWDQGGWLSFAIVCVIGLLAVLLGLRLLLGQLRRNEGLHRTPTIMFKHAEGTRGETILRSPALSHNLEADLERIPDVHDAMVGLFGRYPDLEVRALISVGDHIDLEKLPNRVDEALDRVKTTTGVRPDPVLVTVRFKSADRERQVL